MHTILKALLIDKHIIKSKYVIFCSIKLVYQFVISAQLLLYQFIKCITFLRSIRIIGICLLTLIR